MLLAMKHQCGRVVTKGEGYLTTEIAKSTKVKIIKPGNPS